MRRRPARPRRPASWAAARAALSRLARRVAAVAEPTRSVAFRPAPAQAGPRAACGPLTVLSANLWHDWPRQRSWRPRLEALAALVESERADMLLLQEVSRTAELEADGWLAQRLGMECLYARANGHAAAIGFEEGVAVLSRYPLGRPQLHQFRSRVNPFVRRVVLGASVATPCGPVMAVSLHLSLTHGQNARQLAGLPAYVARLAGPHPALVGGDFNAPEHRASIRGAKASWLDTFRHLHRHADGATHELRWPWGGVLRRSRLDYIFLRPGQVPWQVLDARHVVAPGARHSDHKAVVVRVAPLA